MTFRPSVFPNFPPTDITPLTKELAQCNNGSCHQQHKTPIERHHCSIQDSLVKNLPSLTHIPTVVGLLAIHQVLTSVSSYCLNYL